MSLFPAITEAITEARGGFGSDTIGLGLSRQTEVLGQPAPDNDFWYGTPGYGTWAGNSVSEESSLQSVGVYACNRRLCDGVAWLNCGMYRKSPTKGKKVAPQHWLHHIVNQQPNDLQTAGEYWEYSIASFNLWGNSYSLPIYEDGVMVGMKALNPARMQVALHEKSGLRVYGYQNGSGPPKVYVGDEIFHVPGFSFDGIKGYSPIQLLRQTIGEGLAAEEYGARFFSNDASPRMYVSQPASLGNDARKNLQKWFKDNFGGLSKSHKMGVLEGGGEIKVVPVNHRDIQFLELRKFKLEDIARIFNVPLHLIQNLDRSTNNNIEHQSIDYVMHSIRPLVVRLEQRLNLLLPRSERGRYFCQFTIEDLIRGDLAGRAEFNSKMVASGGLTPNELRAKLDRNPDPSPAADKLYMQGAMLPLDKLGQKQEVPNNEDSET